jgi:hypothetical protein
VSLVTDGIHWSTAFSSALTPVPAVVGLGRVGVSRLARVGLGQRAPRCRPHGTADVPDAVGRRFRRWLFTGERFGTVKLIGTAVTLAGVAWAQSSAAGPPREAPAQVD